MGFLAYNQGNKNSGWRGGKSRHSAGYMRIYSPNHPRQCDNRVYEHILVAERALGKFLPPKAEIHHYGRKDDNNKIVICQDSAYHKLLHQRTRLLYQRKTGGKICTACKVHKPLEDFHKDTTHFDGLRSVCKQCTLEAQLIRRHKMDISLREETADQLYFTN
jgi:hypothetical protein